MIGRLDILSEILTLVPAWIIAVAGGIAFVIPLLKLIANNVRDAKDLKLFGELLQAAIQAGGILDRKWAIEVAGLAPQHLLRGLLRVSLTSSSRVLADAAFAQTARLRTLTPDIERLIRLTLLQAFRNGTLYGDRHAVAAFLKRLPRPDPLLASLRLLLTIPWVDAGLQRWESGDSSSPHSKATAGD